VVRAVLTRREFLAASPELLAGGRGIGVRRRLRDHRRQRRRRFHVNGRRLGKPARTLTIDEAFTSAAVRGMLVACLGSADRIRQGRARGKDREGWAAAIGIWRSTDAIRADPARRGSLSSKVSLT